jgi:DNA polymerase III epsilon subunit-like protein
MLQSQLNSLVVIDVETAAEYSSLGELEKNDVDKARLWRKRCEWLKSRYPENSDSSPGKLYESKASLHAEFSKIVCISMATFKSDMKKITVKSFYDQDEKQLLTNFLKINSNLTALRPGAKYCGHNIKRFDVPFLAKRIIMHGLPMPDNFQIFKMKSWEIPFLDTAEIWSFGAWQEGFTSLDLLCNFLGIESPKDKIAGEDVSMFYHSGKIKEIVEYCEKDVVAVCKILSKWSNLDPGDVYVEK